jgi:hypothetical protein
MTSIDPNANQGSALGQAYGQRNRKEGEGRYAGVNALDPLANGAVPSVIANAVRGNVEVKIPGAPKGPGKNVDKTA